MSVIPPASFARRHRQAKRLVPEMAAAYTAVAARALDRQSGTVLGRLRTYARAQPRPDVPLTGDDSQVRRDPSQPVPLLRSSEVYMSGWGDSFGQELGDELDTQVDRYGTALLGAAWGTLAVGSIIAAAQSSRVAAQAASLGPRVDDLLAGAAADGATFGELIDRTAGFFSSLADWWPARVGGDEAQVTANAATVLSGEWGGLSHVSKVWRTEEDELVRPCHEDAQDQTQAMSDPFDVCGEQLDYPGDWDNGSVENVINCRCHLDIVGPDGEPLTDDTVDDEALGMEMDAAEAGGDVG